MAQITTKGPGIRIWPDGQENAKIALIATGETATDAYEATQYRIGGTRAADHVVTNPREMAIECIVADEDADGAPQVPGDVVERIRSWARAHSVVYIESDWSARARWYIQTVTVASSPDQLWAPALTLGVIEYQEAEARWTQIRFAQKIRKRRGKKKPAPVVSGSTDGLLPTASTKKDQLGGWLAKLWGG